MKDLLYLKDEQIKEFIQLLYYAYRETFSDPKEVLSNGKYGYLVPVNDPIEMSKAIYSAIKNPIKLLFILFFILSKLTAIVASPKYCNDFLALKSASIFKSLRGSK